MKTLDENEINYICELLAKKINCANIHHEEDEKKQLEEIKYMFGINNLNFTPEQKEIIVELVEMEIILLEEDEHEEFLTEIKKLYELESKFNINGDLVK